MSKWLTALVALAICCIVGARLYREGEMLRHSKNNDVAFQELKKLAERGNRKAQYRLARCYDKGHGVTENDSLAFQWYMKAAMQGSGKAMYQVGKCYKNGEGVAQDLHLAFTWFGRAAQDDNAHGQYALGKCYLKGIGVAANQSIARGWLRRAIQNPSGGADVLSKIKKDAAKGDEDAMNMLRIIK